MNEKAFQTAVPQMSVIPVKPLTRFILLHKIQMMMMLNNRNIQISTLEVKRKGIITLLNKLLHLFDNRHFKCRYVHVASELLKVRYAL